MPTLIEDRVVLVKAEFAGRSQPKFGTGFQVDGRTVLTAEHTLIWDSSQRANRIWVLPNFTRQEDDSKEEFRAEPIWWGRDQPEEANKLDLAVLRAGTSVELAPFRAFVEDPFRLGNTAAWQTFGFATAFRVFDLRRGRTCFKGSLRIADRRKDPGLPVTISDEEGERSKDGKSGWRGLSGAPVIVGTEVCGIVCATGDTSERLTAIPTWRALSIESLRESLGFRTQESLSDEGRTRLVEKTAELLRSDADLIAAISEWKAHLAEYRESPSELVEATVAAASTAEDLEDLGFRLLSLKKARTGVPSSLLALKNAAMQLYCLAMARIATQSPERRIRLDGKLWFCPTTVGSVAELMLGGCLGRPGSLKPGHPAPRPKFEIPQNTLEAGWRPEGNAQEQTEEIQTRMVLHDFSMLDPRSAARFSRGAGGRSDITDKERRLAGQLTPRLRSALRLHAHRHEDEPWHVALRLRKGEPVSAFLKQLVELLARDFPQLEFRALEWMEDRDELDTTKSEEESPLLPLWELWDLLPPTDGKESLET